MATFYWLVLHYVKLLLLFAFSNLFKYVFDDDVIKLFQTENKKVERGCDGRCLS